MQFFTIYLQVSGTLGGKITFSNTDSSHEITGNPFVSTGDVCGILQILFSSMIDKFSISVLA